MLELGAGVEEEGERLGWRCLELGAAGCLKLKPACWWWRERREEEENEWMFWVVSSGVCWPEKGGVMDEFVHLFGGHLAVAFCLKKKKMNGGFGLPEIGRNPEVKLALVAWENVCRPKKQGGSNIKGCKLWNIEPAGKLVWWLMERKDSLWVRWVHGMYMNNETNL
ncbi:hypothetical protein H5410_057863 [Solanum commersonii]|uniref:Uncharacterized protein n=1 Tax=Solanum commersonii TaxID=4109 RepID=A0A9J5WPD2_SOLCO|nr:hypothetical protein H5410_057863 [Solanum commersonii]